MHTSPRAPELGAAAVHDGRVLQARHALTVAVPAVGSPRHGHVGLLVRMRLVTVPVVRWKRRRGRAVSAVRGVVRRIAIGTRIVAGPAKTIDARRSVIRAARSGRTCSGHGVRVADASTHCQLS